MRVVRGQAVAPPDAQAHDAVRMVVEVRDVSFADAPSELLAVTEITPVRLAPGARIPFELAAPEAMPGHTLAVRVHVDVEGTGVVSSGDLLTTQHLPVPPEGDVERFEVPLTRL